MADAPRAVQTHMSALFFYGDRVMKIRRPVAYSFADFRDLGRRRTDCEREVALNRRLAPDVYLGTATVSLDDRAVEHGVVMRRLPDDRNLATLIEAGAPVEVEVRHIAKVLSEFHDRAVRSPAISAAATSAALWQRWQAIEEDVGPYVGLLVDRGAYRELTRLAARYLRGRAPLFDRRITEGAVCDGHGDLQAADVFCLDDGPRILDCLEFDDELRYGDVLADVAFLAADLDRLGATDAASALLDEYRTLSGREQPASLVHFYIAARAHVRLLVECIRSDQGLGNGGPGPGGVLDLALRELRAAQVRLVLVGGLPGTGKTTLASWLGETIDAEVLSTDHVRREVVAPAATRADGVTAPDGGSPAHRRRPAAAQVGAGRYTAAARQAVYARLCERAEAVLAMGRPVVLDATWTSARMREMAAAVAHAASATLVELRCDCPPAVRATRIAGRLEAATGESEATEEVALALAATEDPWPTAQRIDTSSGIGDARRAALAVVEHAADG